MPLLDFLVSFIVIVEQYLRHWCNNSRSFICYNNAGIDAGLVPECTIADDVSDSFDGLGVAAISTKLTLLKAGLVLSLMT